MAVARESLSPLVRNVNARRLSLELCQKIGSTLLSSPTLNSPGHLNNSVFSPNRTQSPTVSSTTSSCMYNNNNSINNNNHSLLQLHTPNNHQKSPSSTYRRGSVDEINNNNVLRSLSPMSMCGNNSHNKSRRSSLTPLNSNSHINNGQSLLLGGNQYPIPTINIQDASNSVYCSNEKEKPKDESVFSNRIIGNGALFTNIIPPFNGLTKENNNLPNQQQQPQPRRKSSTSRFDFDDEFMRFVTSHWNLELNPTEILGRGSFGTVIPGVYQGKSVAVKIINTKLPGHRESLRGEEIALDIPPHAHIAQVFNIFNIGPEKALVVMELLRKGSLLSVLNDFKIKLDFPVILRLSGQIATAIQFCHQHGILHLDIKPKNILLDWNNNCKLADFGTSKRICDTSFRPNVNKLDGTVAYKAPELFQGSAPTDKCDVYSFGVCMWQILQRQNPYEGQPEHQIIYQVVAQGLRPGKFTGHLNYSNEFIETAYSLPQYISTYESCWQANPISRPDIKTVVDKLLLLLYFYTKKTNNCAN